MWRRTCFGIHLSAFTVPPKIGTSSGSEFWDVEARWRPWLTPKACQRQQGVQAFSGFVVCARCTTAQNFQKV